MQDVFLNYKEVAEVLATVGGSTYVASKYLGATVEQAAKDGVASTGLYKDLAKGIKFLQKLIRLIKHLGGVLLKEYVRKNAEPFHIGTIPMVKIKNEVGIVLEVEHEILKLYLEMRTSLFNKLIQMIDGDIVCQIINFKDNITDEIEEIKAEHKELFQAENEYDGAELLLPDYEHLQNIEFEGQITKLNEERNSLGFKVDGHILSCFPSGKQHIASYKNLLISEADNKVFSKAKIIGSINRYGKYGEFLNKPQILFSEIIPIEVSDPQQQLF